MPTIAIRPLFALPIFALIAGCSGGGGEEPREIRYPQEEAGGFIVLYGGSLGSMYGEMYSAVTGGTGEDFGIGLGTDECLDPNLPSSNQPTYTYADAGMELTFTGPAATYTASVDTDGETRFYSGLADDVGVGTYTVANSGSAEFPASTLGTIVMPESPIPGGDFVITSPGEPYEITWAGAANADFINVNIRRADNTFSHLCNLENDGAFTFDASITSEAGSGARVTLFSQTASLGNANGRKVILQALTIDL